MLLYNPDPEKKMIVQHWLLIKETLKSDLKYNPFTKIKKKKLKFIIELRIVSDNSKIYKWQATKSTKKRSFSISRLGWFEMIVFFLLSCALCYWLNSLVGIVTRNTVRKKKKERKKLKRAQVNNFNNKNLLSLSKCYYNNIVNKQIKK